MRTNNYKQQFFFIIGTLLIVFLIYLPTLNRDWLMFDEKEIYYNESIFPTPTYFSEIPEVISTYAFNSNFESQNLMLSNIINIRSNPLGTILNILVSYFFKKNAFYHHLLSVFIHLFNTALIWFTFYTLLNFQKVLNKSNLIISSLLTLIWAVHPTNIESTMMSTNWLGLLTYSFCFIFFLHNLAKITNEQFQNSILETQIIAFLFFISLLIAEHSYSFPFIIFFTSLAFTYKKFASISKSLFKSFYLSMPYFIGLLLYFLFYSIKHFQLITNNSPQYQSTNFSIERLFWVTPQKFFHFLKLFFYPKNLSIFQSNLIPLINSFSTSFSTFTQAFFLFFLLVPIVLFIYCKSNSEKSFALILVYAFIFSLFPFLQIATPTYCIIAERYCYFPLFLGLFLITIAITKIPLFESKKILIPILFLILSFFTYRTIIRLNDWKDSHSLYYSATKTHKNKLCRGQAYSALGYYYDSISEKEKEKQYLLLSIKDLKAVIKDLKIKKDKYQSLPQTLKTYGLDTNSLLLNAAFRIASIKFYNFQESPKSILKFYEPYIRSNIKSAGNSQFDLYAKLLLKTNQVEKALKILELAKEQYPFSPTIIFSLSNLYLKLNYLKKAEKILSEGFYYYPNYKRILPRMIKLSELKNDRLSLAKYEYLLGLRTHSQLAYQKALQIYLATNKLKEAKKVLDKLSHLDKKNPITLLLLSKYYLLTHNNDKILETLTSSYQAAKDLYIKQQLDIHIYESILLSLISFNISYGNLHEAKEFIKELEQLPNIFKGTKDYIQTIKKRLGSN